MATGSSNQLFFYFCFFFLLPIFLNTLSSEASPLKKFQKRQLQREKEQQILGFSHRTLLHYKTTEFDSIDPPTTTLPITNPVTTPSLNAPPANQMPPVVTIPATSPVTIPSSTPITIPNTNPVNSPIPVTNPVTTPIAIPGGTPPINPVTTPNPAGGVPLTNPTTIPPPAVVAGQGQSWCIAKNGASQTALQAALDYACGIGGADCASIQQGTNCYNPNSLQNHCSYAFNSYYQKNPVPTSCDFGGVAVITTANPSSGSCIYPSSASSSSSPATANPTPIPIPTTSSSSGSSTGGAFPGAITPPSVLNSSSGFPDSGATTGFGATPPIMNSSSSASSSLQPFICYLVLVASLTMGRFILHM